MRFLIMVKANASVVGAVPDETLIAAMAVYQEALAKAGVLLDAAGLQPSAGGWRIDYAGGEPAITEGPFSAPQPGLLAGYTLIQVRSREEALEWSRRFPASHGAAARTQIEVQQLYERDETDASAAMAGLSNPPGRAA
jgi:hypothetical protein